MAHIMLQIKSDLLAKYFSKNLDTIEESFDYMSPVQVQGQVSVVEGDIDWDYNFPTSRKDIIPNLCGLLLDYEVTSAEMLEDAEDAEDMAPILSYLFENKDALEQSFERIYFGHFDDNEDEFEPDLIKSFSYDLVNGEVYSESGAEGCKYLNCLID